MLKTYTLYLRSNDREAASFEPVMCETTAELWQRAHEILARHAHCDAVEVYFGDTELFRIKQDRSIEPES